MTKALKKSDDINEPGCDLARSCVNYPVISIVFNGYQASEINLTNVKLTYYAEMKNRQTVVSERDICKQNELAKMNTNLCI